MLMGNTPAANTFFGHAADNVRAGGDLAYDRAFWQQRLPMSQAQDIVRNGVPVLLWTGWHDQLASGAIRTYAALQNAAANRSVYATMDPGQAPSPRYQIIVGDWGHAGGLDAGIYLEWFETWLKGVDTGLQRVATPAHFYDPGARHWINLAQAAPVSEYTSWRIAGNGALSSAPQANAGSDVLHWGDPAQPGSLLQFTSLPLADGASIAGPVSATIYARSSNRNLEIIARLFDVGSDGVATEITKGAVLGSQHTIDHTKSWTDRHGVLIWPWPILTHDTYLQPGRAYRLDFALNHVVWEFAPGHRIRLELTTQAPTSICPANGVPAGNGDEVCGLTAPQRSTIPGATYTILHGSQWPSAIHLPQMSAGAFTAVRAGIPPSAWNENQRKLETRDITLPLDWGEHR
jgi:predicted acyl esterase